MCSVPMKLWRSLRASCRPARPQRLVTCSVSYGQQATRRSASSTDFRLACRRSYSRTLRSSAGAQALEPRLDLSGGQVVVAEDRKGLTGADGPPGPVGAADEQVDRLAPAGARRLAGPTAGGQPISALDVREELLGLLAAAADQLRGELVGVRAGDPAALGGVVEDLLDPLAW